MHIKKIREIKRALWLAFIVFSTLNASAITYYVDSGKSDNSGNGLSWNTAKKDLQDAINLASSGDEVWVKGGTYYPTEDFFGSASPSDDREKTFRLKSGVAVYGGFNGTETSLSQRDWSQNTTTLSGDIGMMGDDADNSYHVVTAYTVDFNTRLDGFVVSDGHANGSGVIEIDGQQMVHSRGGGLFFGDSQATFQHCVFAHNQAMNGGGISANYGPGVTNFRTCVITQNESEDLGAGAFFGSNLFDDDCLVFFYYCTIQGNISNSTFQGGAGIYTLFPDLGLTGTIIYGNQGLSPKGIETNNENTLIQYSIIEEYSIFGTSIYTFDPEFKNAQDPDGADDQFMTADDGLNLKASSPVVSSGFAGTADLTIVDIKNILRNGVFEIGAYDIQCGQYGTRLYVDADATGLNEGSSWSNAFTHIQQAINVARSCDNITEVWVAEGTYIPNQDHLGRRNVFVKPQLTYHLVDGVNIYGGFDGTESDIDQRQIETHSTILEGNIDEFSKAYHLLISVNDTSSILVDGFIIKNASGSGSNNTIDVEGVSILSNRGAGVHINNSNITFANCTISNNSSSNGGGIYSKNAFLTLNQMIIQSNTASEGGGLMIDEGTLNSTNSIFRNNTGFDYGGAIYNEDAYLYLSNNLLLSNVTFFEGGALNNRGGFVDIIHCTFYDNSASSGANIGNLFGGGLTAYNSIFYGSQGSSPIFSASAFHTIYYSLMDGDLQPGQGNISADPEFVDASDLNGPDDQFFTSDDGLFIQPTSPARHSGEPGTTMPDTDITGAPRNAIYDMGAYEFPFCFINEINTCKDITVNLGAGSGNYTLTAEEIYDGDISACGNFSISIPTTTFGCNDIGEQIVVLTVSDDILQGSTSTCQANVMVEDDREPFTPNIGNKIYSLNGDCEFIMPNFFDSLTIFDNCDGPYTFSQFPDPNDTLSGEQNFNTFITLTDASGNTSDEMIFNIQLVDLSAPIARCKDFTAELNPGGFYSITFDDIDNGSEWSCMQASIFIQPSTVTCGQIGTTSVQLVVSLGGSNFDACNAQVTVVDASGPDMNCPAQRTLALPTGTEDFTQNLLGITNVSDACTSETLSFSPATFACSDLPTQVMATATDTYGNETDCVIDLQYTDVDPPTALCNNLSIALDTNFQATIDLMQIDNGSFDNCDIVSMSTSIDTFSCENIGVNDVVLRVFDGGNNIDSCTASVTVTNPNPPRLFYVDAQANGLNSGKNWTDAYADLQALLLANCLLSTDSIFMAAGTYYPTDGADQTISHVVNNVQIFGGFSPSNGKVEFSQRDWIAFPTIISGDIDRDDNLDGDNALSTMEIYGDALIDGLTFEMGNADVSSSSPAGRGGGLFLEGSSATIQNCIIKNNFAIRGGGVYIRNGDPTFINCLFYDNNATLEYAFLTSNNSNSTVINCTFTENGMSGTSEAVSVFGSGHLNFINSIVWNNHNVGLDCLSGGTVTVSHSLLSGPTLPGCATDDGGNILNMDPQFIDAPQDNFRTKNCSPVINLGTLLGISVPPIDLFGGARIDDGAIDMGAYERPFGHAVVVTSLANEGEGSLRNLMANACENSIITFDNALIGDTINMPTSGPTIHIDDRNLTINGSGIDQIFLATPLLTRAFTIESGDVVTFKNMNFINRYIISASGGAIRNTGGVVSLENIKITDDGSVQKEPIRNASGATLNISGALIIEN